MPRLKAKADPLPSSGKRFCGICGKVFEERKRLLRHVAVHDETRVRKFECHMCELKFFEQCHLDNHLRTHTGERPFRCPDCGKSYTQFSALNRHRRNAHASPVVVLQLPTQEWNEVRSQKSGGASVTLGKKKRKNARRKSEIRELGSTKRLTGQQEQHVVTTSASTMTILTMRDVLAMNGGNLDLGAGCNGVTANASSTTLAAMFGMTDNTLSSIVGVSEECLLGDVDGDRRVEDLVFPVDDEDYDLDDMKDLKDDGVDPCCPTLFP
ncbi:unnamed protein product [Notodromas monacha]|uniref:C2H2-type domain-containing protein n=1 Tax=Notodromas monacha TaxID=399045 RepID=A0A7R9BSK2_9CRUS|nr:unnamed protein product [Notodromas monacha]CAG0919581.1 unnamed protein product [Notodromas monacha]